MDLAGDRRDGELTAMLIAPNRSVAGQLQSTLSAARSFQILANLKTYPTGQTLEIRLRQLQPEVVLLDLSADVEAALALIPVICAFRPPVHVIGLHVANDANIALRALRLGAGEFLCAPFEAAVQREAVAGILRLRPPTPSANAAPGRIVVFSSAKPGSGASTLACQTAIALKRATNRRILLADADLAGGTVAFYLKLAQTRSLLDAMEHAEHLDAAAWSGWSVDFDGVDVLPAPAHSWDASLDLARFRQALEQLRRLYDWTILDLPAIFHRVSLTALAECDRTFLVTTSELPSLHLARKAVNLLGQLGIGKERLQVLVNRVGKGGGISGSDVEKILNCPVECCFPNDYVTLHRIVALGQRLDGGSLGRAVEEFTDRVAGIARTEPHAGGLPMDARPVFAGA